MSLINFNCSHCNQPIGAPEELAGQTVGCPSCSREVTIPKPAESAKQALPKLQLKKPCPACGKLVSRSAQVCEFCGHDMRAGMPPSSGTVAANVPPPSMPAPHVPQPAVLASSPVEPPAIGKGMGLVKESAAKEVSEAEDRVTLTQILLTPFKGDVFSETFVLFFSFFGWMGLLFIVNVLASLATGLFIVTGGVAGLIALFLYFIVIFGAAMRMNAWYPVAMLLGLFLEIYALVAMFAVLGQLLRKYHHRLAPE